jgi:TRAP-type C4-dicarboxylate transport system substrate-binding protein
MEVNEPDKDAFVAASSAIYEEFATSVPGGKEMVEKAQSLAGGS